MKFDAYQATVYWGAEDVLTVLDVAWPGADRRNTTPANGYEAAMLFTVALHNPIRLQWGSRHEGTHVSAQGAISAQVATLLREQLSDHALSRGDVCEDYTSPGAWEVIVTRALAVADRHGVSVRHEGDWHRGEKGRTVYLGARDSLMQVCIYEKGKQLGHNPDWVRVEYRLRPNSRNKHRYAMATEAQIAGSTPWTLDLVHQLGGIVPDRLMVAPPPKVGDLEGRIRSLARQYGRTLLELFDTQGGDCEAVGQVLVRQAFRERVGQVESAAASGGAASPFFNGGDAL